MKNYLILLLLLITTFLSAQITKKQVWTEADRKVLIDGLESTKTELMKTIETMNDVQLNFKPDSTQWSAKQVLEHLAVYEEFLYWDLTYGIFSPERPDLLKDTKKKDAGFLAYETDPNKGQAPWVAQPLGRFTNKKDLINYHNRFRDGVIEFIKTTKADFRLHFIYREPNGKNLNIRARDLHQQTLIYIAHTARHTNQIKRLLADKNYPVNGKLWSESDRQYTLDNLKRTRDELVKETENLSQEQWKFKESPDRWSIAEIVEHLGNWEIIWAREISISARNKLQPELLKTSKPDSYYHEFIMEDKAHISPDISRPTGLIEGKNNLNRFLKLRNDNIIFTEKTEADMRSIFELTATENPRNLHQVYIYQWGHIDRHLRQIKKVKSHTNYPK